MGNATTFAEMLELTHPTAEATVLAGMMADTETAIELAQMLEPGDFHNERAGVIFQAIRSLLMGIEPIDKAAILSECRQVVAERKLKFTITEANLAFDGDPKRAVSYAQTVKRLAWLRGAADFAHWMIQSLQAHPDPDGLFVEAQERWTGLRPAQKSSAFVYGWDTVGLHDKTIKERSKPDPAAKCFNWPWRSWNEIVRPLRPGMVGIVAAPDGMGKTSVLEMIAEYWAMMGIQTVYVHLEDDLEYKLDRRMARYARTPMERIEDGQFTGAELAALREASEGISQWADRLHYYHAPGKSMAEIVRELETRSSEGVCQAVVFDYLDKVQASKAQAQAFGANTWERQANDMAQLKNFAERNHMPVMTATQGNKSMQNAGTQTRQAIQGSGQKSQQSQLVLVLTRDLVGDEGLHDKNGNRIAEPGDYSPIVNVRVDKQNRGRTGQFQQVIAGRFFTIRDLTAAA